MADLRDVLEWLKRHVPHEYLDPQQVYSEVATALQSNPFIRPRTNIFVHEDGRSELLLCIEGLLPIRYRNNNYKIPIAIWIPQDYPQSPPMVFVTPNKDMIVKQSRNVDANGKCYHPNLANWSHDSVNYRTSNLLAITQLFQRVFSENPPVRSINPPQRPHAPAPPLPPRPKGAGSPTSATPSSPSQSPASPTRPPPPPPPPPRPPSLLNQSQLHVDTNGVSRSSSSSSLEQLAQSPPVQHKSPPPLPPQLFRNNTPPPIAYRPNVPPSSFNPQHHRPRASSFNQQASLSGSSPHDILDSSPPAHSSVLPPPPLPPNPEHARLVKHVNHIIHGHIQPSVHRTQEQQTEARQEREKLLNVEVQAEKEIAELARLKDSCERNIVALRDCIRNAHSVIEWAKNRGEISGDEIVCAQTLVYDQLFNLVAEDLAIDDTMEILAKALDYERITLDVFLKETRKLAREQFLIKALIQKIVKLAGIEAGDVNGGSVVLRDGMISAEYYYS